MILIDEIRARKVARQRGLLPLGCVGILQEAFRRELLPDLRDAFRRLTDSGAYVDRHILNTVLDTLRLPPL